MEKRGLSVLKCLPQHAGNRQLSYQHILGSYKYKRFSYLVIQTPTNNTGVKLKRANFRSNPEGVGLTLKLDTSSLHCILSPVHQGDGRVMTQTKLSPTTVYIADIQKTFFPLSVGRFLVPYLNTGVRLTVTSRGQGANYMYGLKGKIESNRGTNSPWITLKMKLKMVI